MIVVNSLARRLVLQGLETWQEGRLEIDLPRGETLRFGPDDGEPPVQLHIHDERLFRRVLLGGTTGVGEGYMAGEWSSPTLPDLIGRFLRHSRRRTLNTGWTWPVRLAHWWDHWRMANTRAGSRTNIHAHYDLGNDLYQTFLDETMAYSCAIFEPAEATLEIAQRRKYDRICDKLDLQPGDHLLEIGSGWAGFAIRAAQRSGCRITTITISQKQLELARRRIAEAGLSDRVEVRFVDYRDVDGRYDKLVSIEMFEAVGKEYWAEYFRRCNQLLKPGGTMVLQTITWPEFGKPRPDEGGWLEKYIFPGSMIPRVSELEAAVARADRLRVQDVEEISLHYVPTLHCWRERFWRSIDRVRSLGYDEVFVRMWDFYLGTCEGTFAVRDAGDAQLVLRH